MLVWFAFFAGATSSVTLQAAQITADTSDEVAIITLTGPLQASDGQQFLSTAVNIRKAIVLFASPGGSLDAGLQIGKTIRMRGFVTAVPDGVMCASACALAWLGGSLRYMGRDAAIGFHAAYRSSYGITEESGVGNARVGAYLDSIGLSEQAVMFATEAHPDDMRWLKLEDARHLGIDVAILPPLGSPRSTPSASSSPAVPSLVQAATEFLARYYGTWSQPNDVALGYVQSLYADLVDFYGASTPRQTILDMKRKFLERWPERQYSVRPESVKVDCTLSNRTCLVTGLVDWDCRSNARAARSAGQSNFSLRVIFDQSGRAEVIGENGSVMPQSTTVFQQGLADRKQWETWFNSLTGDYHEGARFWSAQRSLPKPGSCFGPNGQSLGDWTAGCLAAQQRLAPADARRKSEAEYRQGWNSY